MRGDSKGKLFSIFLCLAIGLVIALQPAWASPVGKGVWIWYLSWAEGGNVSAIVQRLKDANVGWVAIKCGDGTTSWSFQCNSSVITQFQNAGIEVYGWQYVYGYNPTGEASVANQALDLGIDGFIVDAEEEYEGNPNGAVTYMEAIRDQHLSSFIAYAPFPIIDYHQDFPYLEFGRYSDAVMPQAYWKLIGVTPEYMVDWMDSQWNKWETIWQNGGYGDSVKPRIPLGQGWDVSGNEIIAFVNALNAKEYDYNGVSLWRYDTMSDEDWNAYKAVSIGETPDTTPPPPPINLRATPSSWSNSALFSINWDNPADPSGIAKVWYKVGSPPTHAANGLSLPLPTFKPFLAVATAEGGQPIYVWLEDGAGNKSHNNRSSATLYYDGTAPTCSLSINNGASTTTSLIVTLNLSGSSDSGGSGLYQMRFSNNGSTWSPWESYSSTKSNWDLSSYGGNTSGGTKTAYAEVKDHAGNVVTSPCSDSITYTPPDTTPPPAPINLTANPSSWTSTNSFQINWTNPSDPSGIAAAWYKLGAGPSSPTDGTRTTSKPFAASATVEGGQSVWVWLEDGAGNKDHNKRTNVIIYYDGTAPTCSLSINNGASTTTSLIVTLNLSGSSDSGGSGLYQMRFSNNGSTWSPWESYNSTKSNWDLSSYGGNTSGGTKTAYAEVKDHAGNVVSSPCSDTINYTPPDTTPPNDPTNLDSPSHTVNTPSKDNTVKVTWTAATDPSPGSGVDGYGIEWDNNSTWTCNQVKDLEESATSTTSPALADGDWWFHICTKDNAGNWTSTVGFGPFVIDTTEPALIADFTANPGDKKCTLSWTNPTDSDLAEVLVKRKTGSYPADHNDGNTAYDNTSPTSGGSVNHSDSGLTNGTKYYYAAFSRDDAGNWNDTVTTGSNAATCTPQMGTPAVFRVTKEGDVRADGAYYGKSFETGAADVAEWVPVSEPVAPGDVLELDPENPGYYRKARGPCSTLVAGVVSSDPGVILGSEPQIPDSGLPAPDRALLALLGIVPVKVTDEGGPIQPGDLLTTSSTPGHAMRWDPNNGSPCDFVGKALEPWESGRGEILVLLMH